MSKDEMQKLKEKTSREEKVKRLFLEAVAVVNTSGKTRENTATKIKKDKNPTDIKNYEGTYTSEDGTLKILYGRLHIYNEGEKNRGFGALEIIYNGEVVFIASASRSRSYGSRGLSKYIENKEWEEKLDNIYKSLPSTPKVA